MGRPRRSGGNGRRILSWRALRRKRRCRRLKPLAGVWGRAPFFVLLARRAQILVGERRFLIAAVPPVSQRPALPSRKQRSVFSGALVDKRRRLADSLRSPVRRRAKVGDGRRGFCPVAPACRFTRFARLGVRFWGSAPNPGKGRAPCNPSRCRVQSPCRPCGPVRCSTGPIGTIPVGLISRWVM